jgi:hypothetical protein
MSAVLVARKCVAAVEVRLALKVFRPGPFSVHCIPRVCPLPAGGYSRIAVERSWYCTKLSVPKLLASLSLLTIPNLYVY